MNKAIIWIVVACLSVTTGLLVNAGPSMGGEESTDWPLYGYDYGNSNFNKFEKKLNKKSIKYLRRTWETFNDDQFVSEPRPTSFVLGPMLGLTYPNAVTGVVAGPLIEDGVLYYTDQLGTVFARDPETGGITDVDKHWTRTLVDTDFNNNASPIMPELFYTAPALTDTHIWLVGSFYGQLHAVERIGGAEVDFDKSTPAIDHFSIAQDFPFSSILGESVIINTGPEHGNRVLYVTGINAVISDTVTQGKASGLLLAFDITDPENPVKVWATPTVDINPDTGLRYSTGVSAGAGLAVDFERGWLFGGTGQNTSIPYAGFPDPSLAPEGYVDRGDSVYALDYLTGEYVWINQFHNDDVFDPNNPVSTGPNPERGVRDADVLAPSVLYTIRDNKKGDRDAVANGSKGGTFRSIDRDTGETIWERTGLNKQTGIGGMQAGAAYMDGTIYVATFEGIDDQFSDSQFGTSLATGIYPNAFFATFSPLFWSDVEFTEEDGDPATGIRSLIYALDAKTGKSKWNFEHKKDGKSKRHCKHEKDGKSKRHCKHEKDGKSKRHCKHGKDYVELPGASMRHVSVTKELVYITLSSGKFYVLDAKKGTVLFEDQTPDMNERFNLGLDNPQHSNMNGGSLISNGMVYVPYGGQNTPSGGIYAYEINEEPICMKDIAITVQNSPIIIDALHNDIDPNDDKLRYSKVAGVKIPTTDSSPTIIQRPYGLIEVYNQGDDAQTMPGSFIKFTPTQGYVGKKKIQYEIEDIAPNRKVNGVELEGVVNPTHVARKDSEYVIVYTLSGEHNYGNENEDSDDEDSDDNDKGVKRDKSLLKKAGKEIKKLKDVNRGLSTHVSLTAEDRIISLIELGEISEEWKNYLN